MNTKQVEELTGITRQNIRYYERQGLLEPARDTGNAYRDYSEEDIRRLKLIKMLRMLDMPLKEIEQVLNGNLLLKDAVIKQQETLLQQQKQLQAAVQVCANIQKERLESIDVDSYLDRMERMEKSGSVFARIVDDYKQVAEEERQRQFSFYEEQPVNTAGIFEKALRRYAKEQQHKFQMVKTGMYPEFTLDGIPYTAVCKAEQDAETKAAGTKIICNRLDDEKVKKEIPGNRRAVFQVIYLIGANIRRHRLKSILNGGISMMAVVVLAFYLGNLSSARQQFQELPEAIPVRGTVMNAKGDLNRGLLIRQQVLDKVYASPYVWKVQETAELIGHLKQGEDDGSENSGQPDEFQILGVNSPDSIYEGSEKEILWSDGWNWEKFQESSQVSLTGQSPQSETTAVSDNPGVCIAGKTFLENLNLEKGGRMSCSLERYCPAEIGLGLKREALKPVEMEIVGVVNDTPENGLMEAEVIFPLEAVKQIYEKNDIVYFASSLSFTVKEPMALNELKQELKETGLTSVIPGSVENYAGSALRMEDDVFIQAALGLEKSVSLLEGFLPFILLIVLLAGYMVPHLLLQGRRSEYAVMRALGTGKKRCIVIFFTEHMLLAMTGGMIGAAVAAIFGTAGLLTALGVWALYLCCYTAGAAAAMWMFGRISIAAVLACRD